MGYMWYSRIKSLQITKTPGREEYYYSRGMHLYGPFNTLEQANTEADSSVTAS
jgi:hypothetical protein